MAVHIVSPRTEWQVEYHQLAARIHAALRDLIIRIEHIGSTSVPDLPAKDVIDVQVVVTTLDHEADIIAAFARIGFVPRPGAWNRRDHVPESWKGSSSEWEKLVFAPPAHERSSNIHVRVHGRANTRYALLFMDYLRADEQARKAWGVFKQRLSDHVEDLATYGQIKDPATDVLMRAAELWASHVGWEPFWIPRPLKCSFILPHTLSPAHAWYSTRNDPYTRPCHEAASAFFYDEYDTGARIHHRHARTRGATSPHVRDHFAS